MASLAGTRLLVVEDEEDARRFIELSLADRGAEVRAVPTAKEAYLLLSDFPPDLTISDIAMPGEDGYSFLKKARTSEDERIRNTPAIAVTALARTEDRLKAREAGFQAHISKPVESSVLVAEANRVLTSARWDSIS